MLSKPKIKLINSLSHKKFRDELNLFVAEGGKLVNDLARTFSCKILIATSDWLSSNELKADEIIQVSHVDMLKNTTNLAHPASVIAVFEKPQKKIVPILPGKNELILALDGIQDPGNLGTIIRLADWFACKAIVCSTKTADIYNSKVLQATMGALANIEVAYTDLIPYLQSAIDHKISVYGTFLEGENIYQSSLQHPAIIVMGNEGQGVSPEVKQIIDRPITIPCFKAKDELTSESLNVAMATGIILSEFSRTKN